MIKKTYTLNDLGALLLEQGKRGTGSGGAYRYAYNVICDLLHGPIADEQSSHQLQELINRKCAEVSERLK